MTYKTIPGYPEYSVSTLGLVRGKNGDYIGYGPRQVVRLKQNGRTHQFTAANLMLRTFVRLPREGECALHEDDDPGMNILPNLYWGTRSQNGHDAYRNRRIGRGSEQNKKMRASWKLRREFL